MQASEVKNGVAGDKFFFFPTNFAAVTAAAGVGTDDTGDLLTNMQGALTTTVLGQVKSLVSKNSSDQQQAGEKTAGQAPSFQAAGAVSIDVEVNNSTATITPNSVVHVTGNLTVDANVNDRPGVLAFSGISQPANPKGGTTTGTTTFAGSVAVAIGLYTDTAKSYIDSGATVDAGTSLSVTSEALNDYQFAYLVNLYQAATQTPTFTTSESDAASVNVDPNNIVQVDNGHTAGGTVGDWYQYIGGATLPDVDLTTEDFTNTALDRSRGRVGNSKPRVWFRISRPTWMAVLGRITTLPTPGVKQRPRMAMPTLRWPVPSRCLKSIRRATPISVRSADQPGHRSDLSHEGARRIRPGYGNELFRRSGRQCPSSGPCQQQSGIRNQRQQARRRSAGEASFGWCSMLVLQYSDDDTATIDSGVKLYADSLDVDAETAVGNIDSLISGATSGNFGFIGVFSVVTVNDTTFSQIANGANITIGNADVVETLPRQRSFPR